MTERAEAKLAVEHVDVHEWGPTEGDEEAVLRSLYGEPDVGGIYRGAPE